MNVLVRAYTEGCIKAAAAFAPVGPPAAAKPTTAGTPATNLSPKTPNLKAPTSPASGSAPKNPVQAPPAPAQMAGINLPPTASAAQVAASQLQTNTAAMVTQNPAFKIGAFNKGLVPKPVPAEGTILPDNGDGMGDIGTNFDAPSASEGRVSKAFNDLLTQKPLDLLNSGGEAMIGATG